MVGAKNNWCAVSRTFMAKDAGNASCQSANGRENGSHYTGNEFVPFLVVIVFWANNGNDYLPNMLSDVVAKYVKQVFSLMERVICLGM